VFALLRLKVDHREAELITAELLEVPSEFITAKRRENFEAD
jgi:hypothetical protein